MTCNNSFNQKIDISIGKFKQHKLYTSKEKMIMTSTCVHVQFKYIRKINMQLVYLIYKIYMQMYI